MYMPDRGILSCRDSARTLTTLQYAHEMPEHLEVRRSARERDSHSARGAREGCTTLREETELIDGAEVQVPVQEGLTQREERPVDTEDLAWARVVV